MTPTRREFVSSMAKASLAATIVPRHVLGGPGYRAPSDTVNVAIVGAGGMGAQNAAELTSQNILAICDVDFVHVENTLEQRRNHHIPREAVKGQKLTEAYARARRYSDFRIMLEEEPDIEAVLVATPDHNHAVIAKRAMDMGKHVYVQKPLTWSVHESRVLLDTARRTGVVTQMGNQGHSTLEAATINEWVRGDVIGPIREVHVWTNRPIWPQGIPLPATLEEIQAATLEAREEDDHDFMTWRNYPGTLRLSMGGDWQVPDHLDWDQFLGPAPEIPYHPIYHPFRWRGWVPFGVGALGDMGAHLIDHPYWALQLEYPTTVTATGSRWGGPRDNPASYPQAMLVRYEFPGTHGRPDVAMTWYDGGLLPARHPLLPDDFEFESSGVIYVGDDGLLVHDNYGQNPKLYPQELQDRYGPAPETPEETGPQHEMNWIGAITGETEATSPFELAAPLTENMLLGLVALRTGPGKVIRYDGEAGRVVNEPDANKFLHRDYREGWEL
jgi:predicted dehydrogenase